MFNYNVGLKTLLQEILSESGLYGDLVYKFKTCSEQLKKRIVTHNYSMDILPQTACIVFSIIMAYNVASLFIAQL